MFIKNKLNSIKIKKYNYKSYKIRSIQQGGNPPNKIYDIIERLTQKSAFLNEGTPDYQALIDKMSISIKDIYDSDVINKLINLLITFENKVNIGTIIIDDSSNLGLSNSNNLQTFINSPAATMDWFFYRVNNMINTIITRSTNADYIKFKKILKDKIQFYNKLFEKNINPEWDDIKNKFYEEYKNLSTTDIEDSRIKEIHEYYQKFKDTRGDFTQAKKLAKKHPLYTIGAIGAIGALGYSAAVIRNKSKKKEKTEQEKTEQEKRKEKMDDILNKIEKNANVFNTLDNEYKENKKFCLKAIHRNKDIFKYIPKKLIDSKDLDIDFLIELLKANPDVFDIIFNNSKNKEFIYLLKNKEFSKSIEKTKKKSLIAQLNDLNRKMKRGLFF